MMHPRRLSGSPANIARYYAIGDYYTKGDAEISAWGGSLAVGLGLSGEVDSKAMEALLAGKVAEQQLGRHRQEGIQHHPGWDFAISAPKSVSIMALAAGDARIIEAHEKAVDVALAYLEEHAQLRRRAGKDVVHETTGRLLWARFTEHASRELDPHLHTHVVIFNITNREGCEPHASLESRAMYAEQMATGQIYRNQLAHSLRELGYHIEFDPRRGLFEISGVPQALIREMSQRAQQIDDHARAHGLVGQAERRKSFYATRGPKVKVGLEELHLRWRERLVPHEKSITKLQKMMEDAGHGTVHIAQADARRAALFGIRQPEGREAVNALGRHYAAALASHVGEVRFSDIRPLVANQEERRKLLAIRHQTGDDILNMSRTSRRSAKLEQSLSLHVALALDDATAITTADRLLGSLESANLSPEQERALVHMALSHDRVTGIAGVAGAGKSTLVGWLRSAAGSEKIFVALAPTSSAAAELGAKAKIESRTVASLLADGGRGLTSDHVLVLDEAGQLGNRQALRVLELSRVTGARLILMGDNRQTGAIEQGKAFWLMQRLGLPTAELTETRRQETKAMKAAVTAARAGDYEASVGAVDKVVSGAVSEDLAKGLVAEWTHLSPKSRASTNILVLDNATRLIVNSQIREALKREGVIAAEDSRLSILVPGGHSDQEKSMARFYADGQIVKFSRDQPALGLVRDGEYRVIGVGRDERGRQHVRLIDDQGRIHRWDPRTSKAAQVNVFLEEKRGLAAGDRIQWRLVSKELNLKNAERGTIEKVDGALATVLWDRDGRVQEVDLSRHRTWDHGYGETVYSAQSKTYDRAYVLAPVGSPLVNGQNYYTAITRARLGVKLWTEDKQKLIDKLAVRSGEKTSSLEGLGRLGQDRSNALSVRHKERIVRLRDEQVRHRQARKEQQLERQLNRRSHSNGGLAERFAENARLGAERLERHLRSFLPGHDQHSSPTAGQERDEQLREDRNAIDR
ncbi:MobF family relaxase [Sphingobium cupriresistens]|uniref:TrwC protein n=1 Tax=Sphingobium cupriresistens LL01 TaxID=1420583 RepID=A0A0J7Y2R8_9SPHN|nr:MobF family relaxase [Sphingobium cupriresistens]KMS58236.1 TrwC protein [Sphingobium cupriresistens LL01]